jgi:hypothetical protein
VLCNQGIHTDRNVRANRPDTVIKKIKLKKKVEPCVLIYMAIPADRNVMPKDVEQEIYDYAINNWGHQNNNKDVNKHLEAKPGTHSVDSL